MLKDARSDLEWLLVMERAAFVFCLSLPFQSLGTVARSQFFVECLQAQPLKRLLRLHARLVKSGIESDSVAQLQRIKQSRNPERDLQTGAWEYIEAEQVLRGFVQVFPQASLRRFTVYRENVVECEVYGAGDVLLCVLQWNVLPHYDELV